MPTPARQKVAIAMSHDLLAAAASLVIAYLVLEQPAALPPASSALPELLAGLVAIAGSCFLLLGLHRRVWRSVSLHDLLVIAAAATLIVAVFYGLLVLGGLYPASAALALPLSHWMLLVFLLGGTRIAYRILRSRRPADTALRVAGRCPVLLLGAGRSSDLYLRAAHGNGDQIVGILSEAKAQDQGRSIHGVPILGHWCELPAVIDRLARKGCRPERIIVASDDAHWDHAAMNRLLEEATNLGMRVQRLPALSRIGHPSTIAPEPVQLEDLLGRPQVQLDPAAIANLVRRRRVVITGAGGSIGSELCRQIAGFAPAEMLLLDSSEYNLYAVENDLRSLAAIDDGVRFRSVICNVQRRSQVQALFRTFAPEVVFHAAALKHVPMVEVNPLEGARTNCLGTRNVADAALEAKALAMVEISTDKAVNPTNVMGASKRLAEYYCQALDLASGWGSGRPSTRFLTVRFGNVLGSSGSVVPMFQKQIAAGGPVTVTHAAIRRYFMTIPEAVSLVLQASAQGLAEPKERGRIFVLDMGDPICIRDLAEKMIRLSGLRPDIDVPIRITGLRPGEKLYEELFDEGEERLRTSMDGVLAALPRPVGLARLRAVLDDLEGMPDGTDPDEVRQLLAEVVPGYLDDLPAQRTFPALIAS